MRRMLGPRVSVSGQVQPGQVRELVAEGVTLLICNRPDHEEPGQPSQGDLERAAEAAGITFQVASFQGRPTPEAVEAMSQALASEAVIHAFCRSGMRSAATWAVAETRRGRPLNEVLEAGRTAGYDLAGLFI
ncbi:MAG: TIGR01244 family phosphatase [Caulobacterales bacterium]|nr:TIGR01244 family phosphatase [Caulobacterales bacterium]